MMRGGHLVFFGISQCFERQAMCSLETVSQIIIDLMKSSGPVSRLQATECLNLLRHTIVISQCEDLRGQRHHCLAQQPFNQRVNKHFSYVQLKLFFHFLNEKWKIMDQSSQTNRSMDPTPIPNHFFPSCLHRKSWEGEPLTFSTFFVGRSDAVKMQATVQWMNICWGW